MQQINIFDFDGTLTTDTWPKCVSWVELFGFQANKRNEELEAAIAEYKRTHDGDDYFGFFGFFDDILKSNNKALTMDEFMLGKKYIQYNPGLENFLRYSKADNYIISSGYTDFLQRLNIAQNLRGIYGTGVKKNAEGRITGTDKIMTGVNKVNAINDILAKHGLEDTECENVFYIGDGDTDVPAMKYIHERGGSAVFVYQPGEDPSEHRLANEEAIDYRCVADYTEGSTLWQILNR